MKPKHDAWDWNEIGKELEDECEHNTDILIFEFGRFSICICTWFCRSLLFCHLDRRGITRTFLKVRPIR